MTAIGSKTPAPNSQPGQSASEQPPKSPTPVPAPAEDAMEALPLLAKVVPVLNLVPLAVRLAKSLPAAESKPEAEAAEDDPQKFYETESNGLNQLEDQLLDTLPENAEVALAQLQQVETLAQQYMALGAQEEGDASQLLAERTYEVLEKAAANSPYPEIQKRAELYAAYQKLAQQDFDGAKAAFTALKGDFDEAFQLMKRMKSDELRGRNLQALYAWEVGLEEAKDLALDSAHGFGGIVSGMITDVVDDKTSDDYVYEKVQIERDLIVKVRDMLKSGKEETIVDALLEIDDPRLKPRAHDLLAQRGYGCSDGSWLIAHMIKYVSETQPDADNAEELFRDADQTEARSWVKGSYAIYSLIQATAPNDHLKAMSAEKIATLENGKGLGSRLWDMIRTTSADEVALEILVMKGCQTFGALAKLATLNKLARVGITGTKATALAFSAEVLAEGGAFGTWQLGQEAANHDVEKVLTAEHILKVYAASLIMVGGMKGFIGPSSKYAPRAARALNLVREGGAELSKGGEILVGATNHAAGLGGMVATNQLNQKLGLTETPEGGFLESLAHDAFSYFKYGFAAKGVDRVLGPELEAKSQELQQKLITLHTALVIEANLKTLGYEAVQRTEEGVPVFKDAKTQQLYIQLLRESLTKPGFDVSKLGNFLREGKVAEAEDYAKGFGSNLKDLGIDAKEIETQVKSLPAAEGLGDLGKLFTKASLLALLGIPEVAQAGDGGPMGMGPAELGMIVGIGAVFGLGYFAKQLAGKWRARGQAKAEAKAEDKAEATPAPEKKGKVQSDQGGKALSTLLGLGLGLGALLATENAQAAAESTAAGDSSSALLSEMGAQEGISELQSALKDPSSWVRKNVACALGMLPAREAILDLTEGSGDKEALARSRAAQALKRISDRQSDNEGGDKNLLTFLGLGLGLGALLNPETAQAAVDPVGSGDHSSFFTGLGLTLGSYLLYKGLRWFDKAFDDAMVRKRVRKLAEILNDPSMSGVHSEAEGLLKKRLFDLTDSDFRAALRDENPDVRRLAVEVTVARFEVEEAVSELRAALRDDSHGVRMSAIIALGNLDAQEAIPELRAALTDPSAGVRRNAAWALGRLAARDAIPDLKRALQDKTPTVRYFAKRALEEIKELSGGGKKLLTFLGLGLGLSALLNPESAQAAVDSVAVGDSSSALSALGMGLGGVLVGGVFRWFAGKVYGEKLQGETGETHKPNFPQGIYRTSANSEALSTVSWDVSQRRSDLKSEDPLVRLDAIETLRQLAAREAIPDLRIALRDGHPHVRRAAAEALGLLGAYEAIPDLIASLGDEDWLVRANAVTALRLTAAWEAIPNLIEILKNDKMPRVRERTAEALGELGTEEALPALLNAMENTNDDRLRDYAAQTIQRIHQKISERDKGGRGLNSEVEEYLARLNGPDGYYPAAAMLGHLGATESIPDLRAALQADSFEVRLYAAWSLGVLKATEAIPELRAALKDNNPEVRQVAAGALIKLDRGAKDPGKGGQNLLTILGLGLGLGALLNPESAQAAVDSVAAGDSSSALSTLGIGLGGVLVGGVFRWFLGKIQGEKIADETAKPSHPNSAQGIYRRSANSEAPPNVSWTKLLVDLKNEDPSVRMDAILILRQLGAKRAVPELRKALSDKHPGVRQLAAESLGDQKAREAVSDLWDALQDENPLVRSKAARALGLIEDTHSIPYLQFALRDGDADVRAATAEALGLLLAFGAMPGLIASLADEDGMVRASAVNALRLLAAWEAIPDLIEILKKDEMPLVRACAARALGEFGNEEALPALRDALGNTSNEQLRDSFTQAIAAIQKKSSTRSNGGTALTTLVGLGLGLGALLNPDTAQAAVDSVAVGDSSSALSALGIGVGGVLVGGVFRWIANKIIGESAPTKTTSTAPAGGSKQKQGESAYRVNEKQNNPVTDYYLARLRDPDWKVRFDAVDNLVRQGATEAIPDLRAALQDDSFLTRSKAAWALGKLGATEAIPELGALLQDKNQEVSVRISAASAIGDMRPKTTPPELLAALLDYDDSVRRAAFVALDKIRDSNNTDKGGKALTILVGLGLGLGALLNAETAQAATDAVTSPASDGFPRFLLSLSLGLGLWGLWKFRPRELGKLIDLGPDPLRRPANPDVQEVERTSRHVNGTARSVVLETERRLGVDLLPAGTRLFYGENGRLYAIRFDQPCVIGGVEYGHGDRVYVDADARVEFAVLATSRNIRGLDCAPDFPIFFDSQGEVSRAKLGAEVEQSGKTFREGEVVDVRDGILLTEENPLQQMLWTAASGVEFLFNCTLLATSDFTTPLSGALGVMNLIGTVGSLFFFTRNLRWARETVPALPEDPFPRRIRIATQPKLIPTLPLPATELEIQADFEAIGDEETGPPPPLPRKVGAGVPEARP